MPSPAPSPVAGARVAQKPPPGGGSAGRQVGPLPGFRRRPKGGGSLEVVGPLQKKMVYNIMVFDIFCIFVGLCREFQGFSMVFPDTFLAMFQ